MALTPDQLYRLGAESLGWNNSTAAGKAVIAEDLKLLRRLQLANIAAGSTYLDKASINRGQNPVVQGRFLAFLLVVAGTANTQLSGTPWPASLPRQQMGCGAFASV